MSQPDRRQCGLVATRSAKFSRDGLQLFKNAKAPLVTSRDGARSRVAAPADPRHGRHCRRHAAQQAAGHTARYRSAQHDEFFGAGREHRLSGPIGEQLAHEVAAPRSAADHDPLVGAPAAACPRCFSRASGTIAEKYGLQTPGTKTGRRVVVIVHDEMPKT